MEPVGPEPRRKPRLYRAKSLAVALAVLILYVFALAFLFGNRGNKSLSDQVLYLSTGFALLLAIAGAYAVLRSTRTGTDEDQARQRVRVAEDNLADALRAAIRDATVIYPDTVIPEDSEQVSIKRQDDRLTLAALWDVTHSRLDLYHRIVTGQARRSFWAAQAAMLVGFGLLVVFAVLAFHAKTATGAISVGSLGAVGAAFAAYIGRTFIRSQESAATHLRAYFDQPLELSRYLAAERLMADSTELTSGLTTDQRATILSTLVQAIATAGHENGNAKETRTRGRQTR